jgi:hypothetical protein
MGLSPAFGLLLRTLRPLLWRALALSITPLALALLAALVAYASIPKTIRALDFVAYEDSGFPCASLLLRQSKRWCSHRTNRSAPFTVEKLARLS